MDAPTVLEIAAHSITAVLGVWLGLTVVARSPTPPARVFAFVALTVALWSTSIIVVRLSTVAAATDVAHAIEELTAALVIAATAHLSSSIASEGHSTPRRQRIVAILYVLNVAVALPTILDPAVSPPGLALSPDLWSAIFGWTWVVLRLATIALATGWLIAALREAPTGSLRRRQLRAAIATVAAGGVGAVLRMVPGISDEEPWIGVSFVTLAIILATYAVLSAGIFFGPTVAGRAFRTSMVGGLGLLAFLAVVLTIEAVGQALLGLDQPVFLVLMFVVVIAVYEPVAARIRATLAGPSPRAAARARLNRALGEDDLTGRPADEGVQPALHRLATALDLSGLAVVRRDGTLVANEGSGASATTIAPIPLLVAGETIGELRVGPSTSGAPLSDRDEELLHLSASYVATALRTGRREEEHLASLADLAADRAAVEAQASTLHSALVEHEASPEGMRVFALGPLRVERGDRVIERWGGDKAGTRQAQAMFAFLFDRGERGIAKDEALELIWPDTDIDRADLAFHRTLVGLRRTLEPTSRGRDSRAIRFYNDRYRIDPSLVAWSDAQEFLARLEAARGAGTTAARLMILEEARALYRGEYLDDCPFYGDGPFVEERRAMFRGRLLDLLIALGEGYETTGDRVSAAAAFRDALAASSGDSVQAAAGLARVGA